MLNLYPEIKPYAEHKLKVDHLHTLHIEESGASNGFPVVVLHGGPGAGSNSDSRRFFNPDKYRIILFDQRGCGRSTPCGELTNNTTDELIADLEKIREMLEIEQWMVFGGSWGATLALLYAQKHYKKISSMILRGVFLGRNEDLRWFYENGAAKIFPDYYAEFMVPIAKVDKNNIIDAYNDLLTSEDELTRVQAAKAWAKWSAACATLEPNIHVKKFFTKPKVAMALAKISCHYFANKLFLQDKQSVIDKNIPFSHIPGVIVHGRYDMVCPLDNAYTLHKHWARAELHIIRNAGHSAFEPGIKNALIRATNSFAPVF